MGGIAVFEYSIGRHMANRFPLELNKGFLL